MALKPNTPPFVAARARLCIIIEDEDGGEIDRVTPDRTSPQQCRELDEYLTARDALIAAMLGVCGPRRID